MQQSAAEKDRARTVCKKRDASELEPPVSGSQAKKPRLVFTDLQRRTLQAIFKETKRPSKEMQVTIARQLGLDPSTVSNFFMNARRRSVDKWREDSPNNTTNTATVPQGATLARTVLVTTSGGPATVVQHIGQNADLSPTSLSASQLDL